MLPASFNDMRDLIGKFGAYYYSKEPFIDMLSLLVILRGRSLTMVHQLACIPSDSRSMTYRARLETLELLQRL